jgi:hypothetical protein
MERVMLKTPIAILITLLMSVSTTLGFRKKQLSVEDCPKGLFPCVNCSNIERGIKANFCCFCSQHVSAILNKLSSTNVNIFTEEFLEKVCSQVKMLKENGGKTPFSFGRKPPFYKLYHQIAKLYLLGELDDSPDAGRQIKNLTLGNSDDPSYQLARQIKDLTLEKKKARHPPPKRTPLGSSPAPKSVPLLILSKTERRMCQVKIPAVFDTGSEDGPNPWDPKGFIRLYQAGFK